MAESTPPPLTRIAYLAPEFGGLSGTFVYNEVLAIEAEGVTVQPFGTRRPEDPVVSEEAKPLIAKAHYLNERSAGGLLWDCLAALAHGPIRCAAAAARAVSDSVRGTFAAPSSRGKNLWHFVQGLGMARRLRADRVQHLHIHFAHVPTSIGMYAAMAAGIPFSFTCHANDIFERYAALKEKAARAAFVAAISHFNVRYLESMGCDGRNIHVVRCGIFFERFPFRGVRPMPETPHLLSVGRLVEKKGMDALVDAAAILAHRGIAFQLSIVGGGPLRDAIETRIAEHDLSERAAVLGSKPQHEVRALLEAADVFVLACQEDAAGDRDGIPVALMEAMAMGVPVVSTRVSGIPELIADGEEGFLGAERDPGSIAAALETALADGARREAAVVNARRKVEMEFDQQKSALQLLDLMRAGRRSR